VTLVLQSDSKVMLEAANIKSVFALCHYWQPYENTLGDSGTTDISTDVQHAKIMMMIGHLNTIDWTAQHIKADTAEMFLLMKIISCSMQKTKSFLICSQCYCACAAEVAHTFFQS
jgi:hypothetical protein